MSNTRELSQLASLINVVDNTKSIGVAVSTSSFVGIGTTAPRSKVDILGDALVSGIVTASSFVGNLTGTASTASFATTSFGLNSSASINISGIVTAAGGFNIGIQSAGTNITTGVITAINFVGAGNTFQYNSGSKTIDVSIAGGGGASVSIGTEAPANPNVGDLWFNSTYARTFIYYEDNNSFQWIDASPFNTGIVTSSSSGGTTVSISTVAPTTPNTGDLWFNPNYGKTFIYYADNDSFQWIDSSPSNVGIITTAALATNAQGLVGTPNITAGVVTATSFVGDGSALTGISKTLTIGVRSGSALTLNLTGSSFNVVGRTGNISIGI